MSDVNRMGLLKQAGVSINNFAKYTGIHRVTVSMWVNRPTTNPRNLYWQRAEAALDLIEKGLTLGAFPLPEKKRGDYDRFVAAMNTAQSATI